MSDGASPTTVLQMSNFRIRPLTIVLVLLGLALTAGGIVYFTETAHNLPAFFPGHDVHSTTHHTKHGLAMITLALVAFAGAWFTTAPDRPDRADPAEPASRSTLAGSRCPGVAAA